MTMTDPDHADIIATIDDRLNANDTAHAVLAVELSGIKDDVSSIKRWIVATLTSVLLLGVAAMIPLIIVNAK